MPINFLRFVLQEFHCYSSKRDAELTVKKCTLNLLQIFICIGDWNYFGKMPNTIRPNFKVGIIGIDTRKLVRIRMLTIEICGFWLTVLCVLWHNAGSLTQYFEQVKLSTHYTHCVPSFLIFYKKNRFFQTQKSPYCEAIRVVVLLPVTLLTNMMRYVQIDKSLDDHHCKNLYEKPLISSS